MFSLATLWLPVLLSSIAVFFASSVIHMVLPWHKGDFSPVPDEGKLRDAMRAFALAPGDYCLPRPASMEDMKSPQFQQKMQQGPVVIMTVRPNGTPGMGRSLGQWFVFSLVVSLVAGYVAQVALPHDAPYLRVFQVTGTVAFAGYGLALWPLAIWFGRSWGTTLRSNVDALVYACLTAGFFGWLWH
jgi:hypothetical protein